MASENKGLHRLHPSSRVIRRSDNGRMLVGDRIEAEGRVAEVPCERCYRRRILCLVGSHSKRCAACARSGIKLDKCGVNRDNYREFPMDEEEDSSDESSADSGPGDIPMRDFYHTGSNASLRTAGAGSASASNSQPQPLSLVIDRKIDRINTKTMNGFKWLSDEVNDMANRIEGLEKTVEVLQDRISALEEMVANLAGTNSSSHDKRRMGLHDEL